MKLLFTILLFVVYTSSLTAFESEQANLNLANGRILFRLMRSGQKNTYLLKENPRSGLTLVLDKSSKKISSKNAEKLNKDFSKIFIPQLTQSLGGKKCERSWELVLHGEQSYVCRADKKANTHIEKFVKQLELL